MNCGTGKPGARLMTLEEVATADRPFWFEWGYKDQEKGGWALTEQRKMCTLGEDLKLGGTIINIWDGGRWWLADVRYNRREGSREWTPGWRAWTERPTEEQRRETPWREADEL